MAIKVQAYDTYFGGKSGDGVWQLLINLIPPTINYYSVCLGNCGVTRHIKPAAHNYLNDLDTDVIEAWRQSLPPGAPYVLTSLDAVDILSSIAENSDTPDTFIFIDAPYLFETRKGQVPVYKFEMPKEQHIRLLEAAKRLKFALVMFTHYPCELYDTALQGWQTKDFYSRTRNGIELERVYMNYQVGDRLHDYSCIGGDFREREAYARIRKNWFKKLNRLDPVLRNAILSDLASQLNAMAAEACSTAE